MPGQLVQFNPAAAIGTVGGTIALNSALDLIDRAQNWINTQRANPRWQASDRYGLKAIKAASSKPSLKYSSTSNGTGKMPNYGRGFGKRRSYRKKGGSKARKVRRADKIVKKAKKNRNARVLMRIPRPIGGLTERKVVRLVTSDNLYMICTPPSGLTDGGAINASQMTPMVTRTFCLNDLGAPVTIGGTEYGSGWRPYRFDSNEGGDQSHDKRDGTVPGWDTWSTFYEQAEVVGCKVRIKWHNATQPSGVDTTCYVGYNQTHDRSKLGDAPKPYDALAQLPVDHQIKMSEDLVRAKIFSLKNLKTESPGDTATQYCTFNVRSAFPHGATNDFHTKQTLNKEITNMPGPLKNKSYLTLCAMPTANAGACTVEAKIEMEWTVLYSELKQAKKSTQQIFSTTLYAEAK